MTQKLLVPVYLPGWLAQAVVGAKRAIIPASGRHTNHAPAPPLLNISGEREVEWTFLSNEMPSGPGNALEFGCEHGYLSLMAASKGYRVVAVDLEEQHFMWRHPSVEFRRGDFLSLDLPRYHFDLIINCSSVEHVGLAGRYGITANADDGDYRVMERFLDILKPGGFLLMTAPCGRDAVLSPWCRVYGAARLPRLLSGFRIEREAYWAKDDANQWVPTSRDEALNSRPRYHEKDPHLCLYALAGFVLRKRADAPGRGGC
jgi:SAM-dependent methyltransferase